MVLLCFTLDLRTISPSLLRDLKQCLLQLSNLYAISSSGKRDKQSETLTDRIGLCYVQRNRVSCSDELKIAYSPRGNFSLRDFHHAVNNVPTDGFLPEKIDSGAVMIGGGDVTLAKLLTEEVLYSWGSTDIKRKVVFISSCLLENMDSLRHILIAAADKCVSMEFVLLEQEADQNVQEFINCISDLENCSLRIHHPDTWVVYGLVKQWLQELRDNPEEPLRAVFLFKNDLAGSTNQIFCNLSASVNQIVDGFSVCQTCRCHGLPLDDSEGYKSKTSSSCPITCEELETSNLVENAVRVGEQTILFLPSFQSLPESRPVSAPIKFNVIERTNLGSLSEGTTMGTSYVVTPLVSLEDEATSDVCDKTELNIQVFQGLSQVLHSLDQGLVCSSNCNTETMKEATFQCFYILQPSDKGPMLLKRLAGSEEILPFPDATKSVTSAIPEEILVSIQYSLSRMESRDYNPLCHERGFHPKINFLVKESLHFGSVPLKLKEINSKSRSSKPESSERTILPAPTKESVEVREPLAQLTQASPKPESSKRTILPTPTKEAVQVQETLTLLTQAMDEDQIADSLTEEWEQLIVSEDCKMYSPTCVSIPKAKSSILSPPDVNKQLIEKTSKILERLEAPRRLKTKGSSQIVTNSSTTDACVPKKKPLVPFVPNHATENSTSSSQPMKPIFQRLKRKQR